jgi:hypothetical protein
MGIQVCAVAPWAGTAIHGFYVCGQIERPVSNREDSGDDVCSAD